MITVVLITSTSCAYCPAIKNIVENLKTEYEDCEDVCFTLLDLEADPKNMQLAKDWEIRGVPTILIINRPPNETAFEHARLVGTENISEDKLVYCIESLRTKDE